MPAERTPRRTTITPAERQQLLGLELLLERNRREHDLLRAAVAEILSEEPDEYGYYGHVDDFAMGERGVDELLKVLEITVADPEKS